MGMIHDLPKPEISPDFTIDDIHKIREWNYEKLKDATPEERKEYYKNSTRRFENRIALVRKASVGSK